LQNIFTVTKIVALIGMVLLGFWFGFSGMGDFSHFTPAFPDIITLTTLGVFGAAMTGSLFSADAWNNITYTAGEIENPQRNLPLSLILGTGTVLIIYIFANISYLYILPIDSIKTADNDRVATLMMSTILGDKGKIIMALMIMVSTFGCLNGIILTAARAYYAMAKDGFFFKKAAVLNKNGVPANALVMQCVWACLLTLSGSYGQLLDYIMFAVLIFYCLTVAGVIILRRNQPNMERPYKVWAYPYLPIIYIVLAALVCVNIIWFKTEYSIRGLLVILIGIPIFYYFKKSNSYKNI
nr:amino acid permease [Saprospiraceae bacterium]